MNITTKCTEVLKAIIFFLSNHAGRNNDIMIKAVTLNTILPLSIIDNMTLATTIVEECKSEETGVGLSMAMGNQYPIIHKADFPNTANIPNTQLSIA